MTPSSSQNHNRIAVLTAEVNEAYQSELWHGIATEAQRHNKQLVCFLGSRVDSPIQQEAASNSIYRLAHSDSFDGLIIISSAVSTYLDPQQVQFLFDAHPHIPRVSVGIPVDGVTSVCVDGRRAMAEVTRHLVEVHKRRHFAIIAGPKWHPESEERRQTIIQTLTEAGIHIPEQQIIHGTFQISSGRDAMATLLNEGGPIDALLCLNDRMAMGAIEELTNRGITVPQDISVCGFDGIEESEFCSPPLTTVVQPLFDLGVQAVRELYRLIDGEKHRDITLDCLPLIRQSCACSALTLNQGTFQTSAPREAHQPRTPLPSDPATFLESLDEQITQATFDESQLDRWTQIVDRIEGQLAGLDRDTTNTWLLALMRGREVLSQSRTRRLVETRIQKRNRLDILRSVGTSLSEAFELHEIMRRLTEGLLRLKFQHAFLVLYYQGPSGTRQTRAQTNLGELVFHLEKGIHKPVSPRRLKSSEVLPGNMADLEALSTRIWILTPLVFQDQTIGHLLLPGSHPDTEIYETLTKQIASSIQGARLLEQIKTHEQSLEQEVQRRTHQLTQVNQDLRQEVATRIRLEQEVIDISKHTMERIGQDLHDDLCQHLAGVTMHVSALGRRIAPTAPEALPVVDSINGLLSDSIERAKALVRGLLPPGLREEGISRALENLCNEMARSSGIKVDFNASGPVDGLEVERGIELYRIIQEALNNAVKHSGASRITVELEGQLQEAAPPSQDADPGLQLTARIRDNGKGFVPRPRGKGMGLKIMRYRGEKADIQVHIAHHKPGTEVLCQLIQNPIQNPPKGKA